MHKTSIAEIATHCARRGSERAVTHGKETSHLLLGIHTPQYLAFIHTLMRSSDRQLPLLLLRLVGRLLFNRTVCTSPHSSPLPVPAQAAVQGRASA
jgi:hypothetical protein